MESSMRRDIVLEALAFVVGGHDGGGCGRRSTDDVDRTDHGEPAPVDPAPADLPAPEPYFEDGGGTDAITLDVHAEDLGYEDHVAVEDADFDHPIANGHDDVGAPVDLDHDDTWNEDDYSSQGSANDTVSYDAHEDASAGGLAEHGDVWSGGASFSLDAAATELTREPSATSVAYETSPRADVSEWSYGDAGVRLDVRSGG